MFSGNLDDPTPTSGPPWTELPPFLGETGELHQTTGPAFVRGEHVGSASQEEPRTRDSSGTDFSALTRGVLRAVTAAAAAILINVGRQLRRPSAEQLDAIAAPLARIAVRHLPIDKLSDTLLDTAELGGAVAEYAADGPVAPLIYPPVVHVGMVPADPADPAPPAPIDLDANPGVETPPPPPAGGVTYAD